MRFVKQLIYGLVFLAVIGGVGFGVYKSNLFVSPTCFDNRLNQGETETDCGGPNCQSCELKHLQPLRTSLQYFPTGSNTNAVVVFSNPNLNYGATFNYTATFFDADHQPVYSFTRATYLYPAEAQRVIIEPNLPFATNRVSGSPEVSIADPEWKPAADFMAPSIQIRQVNTTVSGTQATVTGIFANRESFALSEASVGILVSRKSNKLPLGASRTILTGLKPFEERAFQITIPLSGKFKVSEIDPLIYSSAKR